MQTLAFFALLAIGALANIDEHHPHLVNVYDNSCNPYLSCECACVPGDPECVRHRIEHKICPDFERAARLEICDPHHDCRCPCRADDLKCIEKRFDLCGRRNEKDDVCNPYLTCECACVHEDHECERYRKERGICQPFEHIGRLELCDPHHECRCACRADDLRCIANRFELCGRKNEKDDVCNPYLTCECACVHEDHECVRYRKERGICQPFEHLRLEACDAYRSCECPCPAGDFKCALHRRDNRLCLEEDRKFGFGEHFFEGQGGERHRRHESSSESHEGCHCSWRRWGAWCEDPIWRCLNEYQRLEQIP